MLNDIFTHAELKLIMLKKYIENVPLSTHMQHTYINQESKAHVQYTEHRQKHHHPGNLHKPHVVPETIQ